MVGNGCRTALDDVVGAVYFSIGNKQVRGPVNVVSPHPVRNAEFTQTLANLLGRRAPFAVPATFLRLALGEMADRLLLASQRVYPERLLAMGYRFQSSDLAAALRSLLVG
jgi:NAD dependent epimerase/dehydratase family enzyme